MSLTQELEYLTTELESQPFGGTSRCTNCNHDLVHELSRRLDGVWRYEQYLANAEGLTDLEQFWSRIKEQEQANVEQLKQKIAEQIATNRL